MDLMCKMQEFVRSADVEQIHCIMDIRLAGNEYVTTHFRNVSSRSSGRLYSGVERDLYL